ncbi:phage integrase N-terminal SAM-like domain-containing protein [Sorangium sp. So ce117]|uniref:phage integrase N-terminal SAM-like domain-containing protein n=1 Tax=Sorangium sp. So ce117 TaxID=3133277 RepID=UPI003F5F49A5
MPSRCDGRRRSRDLGPAHVEVFLTRLVTGQHASASTQSQAPAAIHFLYTHVVALPPRAARRFHPSEAPRAPRRGAVDGVGQVYPAALDSIWALQRSCRYVKFLVREAQKATS